VDYYQSLVAGVVIMAIFLGTLTTDAFNLVMDIFPGIDESYLLTPLSKSHIVTGLIISGLSVRTMITVLIFTASMVMTGIPLSKGIGQFASILAVIYQLYFKSRLILTQGKFARKPSQYHIIRAN